MFTSPNIVVIVPLPPNPFQQNTGTLSSKFIQRGGRMQKSPIRLAHRLAQAPKRSKDGGHRGSR
eukprot:214654-Amorphochlora_amoeboformis.AAC.2